MVNSNERSEASFRERTTPVEFACEIRRDGQDEDDRVEP